MFIFVVDGMICGEGISVKISKTCIFILSRRGERRGQARGLLLNVEGLISAYGINNINNRGYLINNVRRHVVSLILR